MSQGMPKPPDGCPGTKLGLLRGGVPNQAMGIFHLPPQYSAQALNLEKTIRTSHNDHKSHTCLVL